MFIAILSAEATVDRKLIPFCQGAFWEEKIPRPELSSGREAMGFPGGRIDDPPSRKYFLE